MKRNETRQGRRSIGRSLLAGLVLAPSAAAQELLWYRDGPDTRTRNFVGWVGPGPDLDGDGVGEVLASDMFYDTNRGAVFVYSGVDGELIERIDGADPNALFGNHHTLIPDRDGDGVDDIIVGAQGDSSIINESGRVYLYSGATRTVIHAFDPILNQDCLRSGILFPDWDGDGVEDYIVSAPCYPDPAPPYNIGYIRVHSGVDYAELWYGYGAGTGYYLGTDIACAGDTDGDGVADLLAGAPGGGFEGRGEAYIYSGRTHEILHTLRSSSANPSSFGGAVAAPGDLDGDGCADVLAAGHCTTFTGKTCDGEVVLFSGKTGAELHRWQGLSDDEKFGFRVDALGDLDGDGFSEILVGAYGAFDGDGRVYLFSGRTRRLLYLHEEHHTEQDVFGWAARGVGDVNQDGIPDYGVGAKGYQNSDGDYIGRLYVFAGNDFWLQANCKQCNEGDSVDLHLRGGEPDAFSLLAVVAVDGTPTFHPLAFQRLDTHGEATFTATVPPGLSGHTISTQAWTTRTITQGPPKDSSPATIEVL